MLQINPLDDWLKTRWARDSQTRTHGSWILCSVSRVRSKTMDSRFCITSQRLPYIYITILCYIHSRFFLPWNYRARQHGSIRLPPRSLASSRGRTLAIRMGALVNKKTFERGAYWRWVESLRYLLLSILTLRLLLFVMRFIKSILGYWVVCGTVHFCCYYFFDEINGIIYNPMDLVNSKLDN